MGYVNVSTGGIATGASGAAVTPAFAATTTVNHLLICCVSGSGVATIPATPSGWSLATSVGESGGTTPGCSAIFYKIAAGSDTAPTIALITGQSWSAKLMEFSGNATVSPLDKVGSAGTATTLTWVMTASAADTAAGELVIAVGGGTLGKTSAIAFSAGNNGMTFTSTASSFFGAGYAITTGNSAADSCTGTETRSGTGTANQQGCIASFKLAPLEITRSTASAFPLMTGSAPSVTLGATGDIVTVVANSFAAITGVTDTGGILAWVLQAAGSYSSYFTSIYTAVVTAAAAGSTITITPTTASLNNMVVDEYTSPLGASTTWTVTNPTATNFAGASSTTVDWPSITTGVGTYLAWAGYVWCANTVTGGTNPVNSATFTYTLGGGDVAAAFCNTVVASTAYTPVAAMGTAGTNSACGLALEASLAVTRPYTPNRPFNQAVNRAANW